jgi:hypothetical protein
MNSLEWFSLRQCAERLPELVDARLAGGPGNPLGARAVYPGGTVYRIHGTNTPATIGTTCRQAAFVSPMKTSLNVIPGSISAPG